MTVWQPIETAPRTRGVLILVFGEQRLDWDDYEYTYSVAEWAGDDWYCQRSPVFGSRFVPTHWMPLPPPPSRDIITVNQTK